MCDVVVQGVKCALVEMKDEYLPFQVVYLSDPQINRFLLSRGPFSIEHQRERLRLKREKREQVLAIVVSDPEVVADNWKFIGVVELRDFDEKRERAFSASFLGNKSYWGRGIAREAKLLQLFIAFKRLGLRSVFATTVRPNTRSQRMLESVGYRLIEVRPQARVIDAIPHDEFLYCVSREDWSSFWLSYLAQCKY